MDVKFDRVVILDGLKNVAQVLSPDSFKDAIPVADRVKMLCEGKIKFFLGSDPVPAVVALKRR